ncbi:MAG: citramalate synthase [Christensenellaceae bacterium]|jgi:2-isopropylmalate synthase|nr:citramalate synthase [Christensenellaceae bacterium]
MRRIEILDSTLRDGAQGESVSFSVSDKLSIVRALDAFGVDYIEAGNPASNPKDMRFFEEIKRIKTKQSQICAFGSTRRKGISVDYDEGCSALLAAGTRTVSIFGKASKFHVQNVIKASKEENLNMITDTVRFFKQNGRDVLFDAEHFFDGYMEDSQYALFVLKTALIAGASVITLCDTNGGILPFDLSRIVNEVIKEFSNVRIGIHCHNDTGCAIANSIIAVNAGASHVQGTFIGIGERCGNADLGTIIPNLVLKTDYNLSIKDLSTLTDTVSRVYDIANLIQPSNRPYTGSSSFTHKGGMHIDGVDKNPESFEHVTPQSVGNRRRYLISEMSGKRAVINKLSSIAPELTKDSPETDQIVKKLKDLEFDGYQFESADASFELTVLEMLGKFKPSFNLQMYRTSGEYPSPDGKLSACGIVKIEVDGECETTASFGNGPVNALDLALRDGLARFYPAVKKIWLTDYKVRVLSDDCTTGSKVRVLTENTDGKRIWTTTGVSTDIIAASWKALKDAIEYYFLTEPNAKKRRRKKL